jgi:hypothetical protein
MVQLHGLLQSGSPRSLWHPITAAWASNQLGRELLAHFAKFAKTGVARQYANSANSANNALSQSTDSLTYQTGGLTFSLLAAHLAAHVMVKATGGLKPAYLTCHECTSALYAAGGSFPRTLHATAGSIRSLAYF